ncbi:MAG: thymidine phosphorylase, partial [Steroidobacteraceae bacterium]
ACGVVVPKMSGRGLGHTGGTLDKLESIPGFRIDLSIDEFKQILRDVGTCIIGQTKTLAPADKTLYALRDVTATIESIPLISASIMSKKLAEGSNALVLDVKCGNGAFMKDVEGARALATSMVAIGTHAGVRTEAVISDMDAPLGRAVGNSLEIIECLETLTGGGPPDLAGVVRRLAARMLVLGGVERDETAAAARVENALASQAAAETFRRMVERQGGNPRVMEDHRLLPHTDERIELPSPRDGYVAAMRAESIGRASNALGAGRSHVGDAIDHAVGITLLAKPGDRVSAGQPLLVLHHRNRRGVDEATAWCRGAYELSDTAPPARPKILGEVR